MTQPQPHIAHKEDKEKAQAEMLKETKTVYMPQMCALELYHSHSDKITLNYDVAIKIITNWVREYISHTIDPMKQELNEEEKQLIQDLPIPKESKPTNTNIRGFTICWETCEGEHELKVTHPDLEDCFTYSWWIETSELI